MRSRDQGVPPQAGSGHSPKGGAAISGASPAKPSVPNAERPWQPWERNYSGNRVGVQEQQGENENWVILHVESGGAKTTTSLTFGEAWDLATRLSPPLAARMNDLFRRMREAQDALHQFTWADTIAPTLRKVADDWDCDSATCEFASDDMGGLSCPHMESERGCRAVEANELRQFADALEIAESLRKNASENGQQVSAAAGK